MRRSLVFGLIVCLALGLALMRYKEGGFQPAGHRSFQDPADSAGKSRLPLAAGAGIL